MLTDQEIERAKARTRYSEEALHEHPDCIRLAYEWLDAQKKRACPRSGWDPVKHKIEHWAGRYISTADVEVAAELHPRIVGRYPMFNLSSRFTLPHDRRLAAIGEALTQGYRQRLQEDSYALTEA